MTDYPCRYCQKRHPGGRAGGQAQHGTDLHGGAESAAETTERKGRGDMTDKRYPTRMHEVLGVGAFEQFQIKGVSKHFFLTAAGQICSNEAGMDNNYLIDAINRGIIRKPRLSEEQVEQFKVLHKALKGQVVDIEQTLRDAGVEVEG